MIVVNPGLCLALMNPIELGWPFLEVAGSGESDQSVRMMRYYLLLDNPKQGVHVNHLFEKRTFRTLSGFRDALNLVTTFSAEENSLSTSAGLAKIPK